MTKQLFFSLVFASLAAAQVIPNRYLVELAGEPAAVAARGLREARRAQVAAVQQPIRRIIEQRGGRVLASLDTVLNLLVVEGDEATAARLASAPAVLRVRRDRTYHARLDRVIPLMKVSDVWTRIGGADKAGFGIGIAVLDTGIDAAHAGFKDSTLPALTGYPKFSSEANKAHTSSKVVVARSYEDLQADPAGYGEDARDVNSHGTNAAMAAAGVSHVSPRGVISGVAPKAYLGNYKVLGNTGGGSTSGILKAIDDAVKDGFDVLNLSLGSDFAGEPNDDVQVKAVERAFAAGVIVVVAAGNAGPDANTIGSPATAPNCIAVGSSSSDRGLESVSSEPKPIDPNRQSDFSSRGPNPGDGLKPDMSAIGDNFYTAVSGFMPDSTGYTITQGTSFAAPVVAGAAALLKAARPGLTAATYRSLLINSSRRMVLASGQTSPLRVTGAGVLDMDAAVRSNLAALPTSIKFGVGDGNPNFSKQVTLTNLGTAAQTVTLAVDSVSGTAPELSATSGTIEPGKTASFAVQLTGAALAPGEYQGFVRITAGSGEVETRIPYWYAIASTTPASITLLEAKSSGKTGSTVSFGVRVLDASGIALSASPNVTSQAGGGSVVSAARAEEYPNTFAVEVKLAAGENVFRIDAGVIQRDVTIVGE